MANEFEFSQPGQTATLGGRYARSRSDEQFDPAMRRILLFVAGAVLAVGAIAGVISAVAPRRSGVPVIEASTKPLRERPPVVAGAATQAAVGDVESKPVVSPAPETPSIAALTQPAPTPAAPPATASLAPAAVPPPLVSPLVTQPPAAPVSAPAPAPLPVTSVAARPTPAATPSSSAPTPAARAPSATAPKAAPTGAIVQLAAVGSEAAAMSEWQRLSHRFPELLGDRRPLVSHTERDGKTYWRLRVAGFTDIAGATGFCGQMKSRGANCALASF